MGRGTWVETGGLRGCILDSPAMNRPLMFYVCQQCGRHLGGIFSDSQTKQSSERNRPLRAYDTEKQSIA